MRSGSRRDAGQTAIPGMSVCRCAVEVLYERIYLNGDFHRVGSVVALSYGNDDRLLEAYQFGEDAGHYDGQGRPLCKLFLKSPLRYSLS